MRLHFRLPRTFLSRSVFAVFFSFTFVFSFINFSILAIQKVQALGIDAGSLGAAGSMGDCSDSGILVAFAGAKKLGNCPLKHTDVKATVSGYVARVTVKQQFHNPYNTKIEASYTFPLPHDAAVDEMTMKIGNRVIKGSIKKREEARKKYEEARARGQIASLLDQERPNIFNQSVANIEPGQNIDIEIKYVNLLKYENGAFSFVFPTVVGPRFIPGHVAEGRSGHGHLQDTDMVPDASKITPPAAQQGERAGHDISINLAIDAGVPIQSVKSLLHEAATERTKANLATVKLIGKDRIPNKDFICSWTVASDSVQSGYLAHKRGDDGFISMMLIPPIKVKAEDTQPKEIIFLLDCSGSQSGLPIQKAKETMEYIVRHMNPTDSFRILAFNSGVSEFSKNAEHASVSMLDKAIAFIQPIQAQGGTWMEPAVERVCSLENPDHKLRIVVFMTDGYVGNDMQVISTIRKFRGQTRWFPFGTGNSVNRFLIDKIAEEGGGEAEYVLLNSSAQEVGKKFYDRISSPVLSDIKLDFENVEIKELFPKDPRDLWAQKPLYFSGRYKKAGSGKVILSGYSAGKAYRQELKVDLPQESAENDVLPSVWARAKVERLMSEDWLGVQLGKLNQELKDEIVQTALKYHIMSQYTSFVAVDESSNTGKGKGKLVPVKVENPDGVEGESGQSISSLPPPPLPGAPLRSLPNAPRPSFGKASYGSAYAPAPIASSGYGYGGGMAPAPPVRSGSGGGAAAASPLPRYGSGGGGGTGGGWSSGPMSGDGGAASLPGASTTAVRGTMMRPTNGKYLSNYGDRIKRKTEEQEASGIKEWAKEKGPDKNSSDNKAAENKTVRATATKSLEKISPALSALIKKSPLKKVTVRVELSESPGSYLLSRLNKLGLDVLKREGKTLIANIELSKIEELSQVQEILKLDLG